MTKSSPNQPKRRIGYDDRTGAPEGLPRAFAAVIIEFPDRAYGTWWRINNDGTRDVAAGWYIWIESLKLVGITWGDKIAWHTGADFETALTTATKKLRAWR
jgi:hypothetical protein